LILTMSTSLNKASSSRRLAKLPRSRLLLRMFEPPVSLPRLLTACIQLQQLSLHMISRFAISAHLKTNYKRGQTIWPRI
jgi:hypothetical protein